MLVQCARAYDSFIYYINAHLPHAREFSAYARECITRKLSVASGPALQITNCFEDTWFTGTAIVLTKKFGDFCSTAIARIVTQGPIEHAGPQFQTMFRPLLLFGCRFDRIGLALVFPSAPP